MLDPIRHFHPCPMFVTITKLPSQTSGWKPTHLTSVFSLWTYVLSPPDGTMLTAFTYVNMDVNTDVADVIGWFPPTPLRLPFFEIICFISLVEAGPGLRPRT